MACNLAVHGPRYVAEGSGSNFIKQAQHQTLMCAVPPFYLARHASPDICHPKDIKPLSSQVHGSSSYDKTSVHWHKVHPQDASTQSRLVEEFERFQNPVGGMIKLNPIVNPNLSEANNFRAQSKLNLCVQFADMVEERKQDEKESSGIKMAADESASPSSSIGQVSQDSSFAKSCDKPSEEMEVQSSLRNPLDHMGCLQKSLPIKRGLSKFFSGKSRSFMSLSDVSSIRDLAKAENPYAKKRKWHGSVNVNLSGDAYLSNPVAAICRKKPFSVPKAPFLLQLRVVSLDKNSAAKHP